MPWLQVTLATDRERATLIEVALENAGALAITLSDAGDEPQLEPPPGATPLWGQVQVIALFEPDNDTRRRAEALAASLAGHLADPPRFERIEDQAWEHTWKDDFAPTRYGERLWVCPRGQRPEDDSPDRVIVALDPGLAFGTGHHPTTALCLRWLDRADLIGSRLIDYGCGSGILAIAALKLGAAQALAIDHDPQALEATLANATENDVALRLRILMPKDMPEGLPEERADRLVANILAGPLIELAPELAALVRPGGELALSGLLVDQIESLATAYAPWFDLEPPQILEDWVLLAGTRREGDVKP
jgi:ribosomal protein L11 methyltransferase